jgi:hypothetical protein
MRKEETRCNIVTIWVKNGIGISFLVKINGFGFCLMIKGWLDLLVMVPFL